MAVLARDLCEGRRRLPKGLPAGQGLQAWSSFPLPRGSKRLSELQNRGSQWAWRIWGGELVATTPWALVAMVKDPLREHWGAMGGLKEGETSQKSPVACYRATREFGMGSGGGPRRRLCGGSHEKSQNKVLRIPARGGMRRASVDGLPKLPSSSPAPTLGAGACELQAQLPEAAHRTPVGPVGFPALNSAPSASRLLAGLGAVETSVGPERQRKWVS